MSSATFSSEIHALARACWNADRSAFSECASDWKMPAWSKAPAWQRRPYLVAAQQGKHPTTNGLCDIEEGAIQ